MTNINGLFELFIWKIYLNSYFNAGFNEVL